MEDTNITSKIASLEVEQTPDIDTFISDEIETLNSDEIYENNEKSGFLRLPYGKALTLDEIYQITASEESKIIAFIGPFESGKTTIETTLYQMFQRTPFCGLCFSDSATLSGYEERSFYTRLNSKNKTATTLRTSRFNDEIFLHMKLFDLKTKSKTNYLFADISGETIFSHKGNVTTLKENMPFLKAANDYTFVLDGKQLADKTFRNGSIDSMRNMARTIFDAELFTNCTCAQIIISKYDVIGASGDDNLKAVVDASVRSLVSLVSKYIPDVTVHHIAAMPQNEGFDVGYGLEELLETWKQKKCQNSINIPCAPIGGLKSEFNKLNYKLLGGKANG